MKRLFLFLVAIAELVAAGFYWKRATMRAPAPQAVAPAKGGPMGMPVKAGIVRTGAISNRWVLAASFQDPGSIWRFSVDGREEPLQLLSGEAPRGFTMSPDGRHKERSDRRHRPPETLLQASSENPCQDKR